MGRVKGRFLPYWPPREVMSRTHPSDLASLGWGFPPTFIPDNPIHTGACVWRQGFVVTAPHSSVVLYWLPPTCRFPRNGANRIFKKMLRT